MIYAGYASLKIEGRQNKRFRRQIAIKKVKTSHKGRKCKYPHCRQILSIYNHESYCHVHLRQDDYKERPKVV